LLDKKRPFFYVLRHLETDANTAAAKGVEMRTRNLYAAMALLLVSLTSLAHAISPLASIKQPVQLVVDTLNDPQYKDPAKRQAQKDIIWDSLQSIFSFVDISKIALGRNWAKFTSQERKEFTDVFTDLLSSTYLDKIQRGEYEGLKIQFLQEEIVKATIAKVDTVIINKEQEIPVSYSMILRNDSWKIYDIRVEGVSLIKNYRVQFHKILSEQPPANLIERLRKKVEELNRDKAPS
jgi:phospholipid transport system substrate-binding protein